MRLLSSFIVVLLFLNPSAQAAEDQTQDLIEAIKVTSITLARWNPNFSEVEIAESLIERVKSHGIEHGVLLPMLNIVDASYIVGKPDLAKILSPSIAKLSPQIGKSLHDQLGLPVKNKLITNSGALDLSKSRQAVREILPIQFENKQPINRKIPVSEKIEFAFSGEGSVIDKAISLSKSLGIVSELQQAPLSQRDLVSMKSCFRACATETILMGAAGAGIAGPPGVLAGAAVGGPYGATVGGALTGTFGAVEGAVLGLGSCADMPECGGGGSSDSKTEVRTEKPSTSSDPDSKDEDKSDEEQGEDKDKDKEKEKEKKKEKKKEKDKDTDKYNDNEACKSGKDDCSSGRPANDERASEKRKSAAEIYEERKAMRDAVRNPSRVNDGEVGSGGETAPKVGRDAVIHTVQEGRNRLPTPKSDRRGAPVVLPAIEKLRKH